MDKATATQEQDYTKRSNSLAAWPIDDYCYWIWQAGKAGVYKEITPADVRAKFGDEAADDLRPALMWYRSKEYIDKVDGKDRRIYLDISAPRALDAHAQQVAVAVSKVIQDDPQYIGKAIKEQTLDDTDNTYTSIPAKLKLRDVVKTAGYRQSQTETVLGIINALVGIRVQTRIENLDGTLYSSYVGPGPLGAVAKYEAATDSLMLCPQVGVMIAANPYALQTSLTYMLAAPSNTASTLIFWMSGRQRTKKHPGDWDKKATWDELILASGLKTDIDKVDEAGLTGEEIKEKIQERIRYRREHNKARIRKALKEMERLGYKIDAETDPNFVWLAAPEDYLKTMVTIPKIKRAYHWKSAETRAKVGRPRKNRITAPAPEEELQLKDEPAKPKRKRRTKKAGE
jgi:hypothetical protein